MNKNRATFLKDTAESIEFVAKNTGGGVDPFSLTRYSQDVLYVSDDEYPIQCIVDRRFVFEANGAEYRNGSTARHLFYEPLVDSDIEAPSIRELFNMIDVVRM